MKYHGNMVHINGSVSSAYTIINNNANHWDADGIEGWSQAFTPPSGSSTVGVTFWYNNNRGAGICNGIFYLTKYRKGVYNFRTPTATSQALARCFCSNVQAIGANTPFVGRWIGLRNFTSTTVAFTGSAYSIVFWPSATAWPANTGITLITTPSSMPYGATETVRYFDRTDSALPGYATANGMSTSGAYLLCTSNWYNSAVLNWIEIPGHVPFFPLLSNNNTFLGQPYIASNYYNTNRIQWQKIYVEEPGAINIGVYIAGKSGTPVRLKYLLSTAKQDTAVGSYFLHSATFNTDGWTSSGWFYASTAFSTPFVGGIGRNAKIGIVTGDRSGVNYWKIKGSDVVHRAFKCASASSWVWTDGTHTPNYQRDLVLQYYHNPSTGRISGRITEYQRSVRLNSCNIKVYPVNSGTIISSALSTGDGYYTVNNIPKYNDYIVRPTLYDWDYVPQYQRIIGLARASAINFVQSSESLWWGGTSMSHRGKEWAFRQRVIMSSPHATLRSGQTVKVPFQTGYLKTISHTAYFNESLGGGGGPQIIYGDGKTHAVWKSKNSFYVGATYDWSTNTWTEKVVCSTSYGLPVSETDTHIAPALCHCTYDKHLYMTISTHDSGVIKLLKSRQQNDLLMSSTPLYSKGNFATYSELLSYDKYIYLFFRQYVGLRSARSMIIFDISTSPAIVRTFFHTVFPGRPSSALAVYKYQDSWNRVDDVSLYGSGVTVDSRGTLYKAIVWHDNYGAAIQYGRAISCMYSPVTSSGFAGNNWYTLSGHTCAVPKEGKPLVYMKPTYSGPTANPFVIYTSTADRDLFKLPKYSYRYFSNVYSIFCHPTESFINDRGDRIQRPYFSFISTDSAESIYAECRLYVATYNTSVGAASLSTAKDMGLLGGYKMPGWIVHTISHLQNGIWQKGWKNRHVGALAIDNNPTIHVYGMIKPGDLTWGAGELGEWYSDNQSEYYSKWNFRNITDRSGYGIGMPMAKRDFSNNTIEMVYGRGTDVLYYAGIPKYDRLRSDCLDLRVVYGSALYNAIEIDRVMNLTNFSSSEVYFKLLHTIPKNKLYDPRGNYYLYYGRYTTAQAFGGPNPDYPKADPTKTMVFFDGFETYANNLNINGTNGWFTKGSGPAIFRVRDSLTEHTNKLFSGDKSLKHSTMTPITNQIVLYHTIPDTIQCIVKFGFVPQDGGTFIGIAHSAAGQYQYIYSRRYQNASGDEWLIMASTLAGGKTNWCTVDPLQVNYFCNRYTANEDIFYLNDYGTNIYDIYGTFVDGHSVYGRSYSRMRNLMSLHTVNQIIIGQDSSANANTSAFVDHIRVVKLLGTPHTFHLLG